MKNQFVPIGKLFDLEKGQLQSTKCTPGEFDFITAADAWKTHSDYTHECEALIFAAAASGSLGRTHYVNGKFVTSDLCFIMTPTDEAKYPLNLAFYHFVFNSLRSVIVAATKAGTSKESINQTNFKNYEIPYFDIERQDLWIEKLKGTLGKKELLGAELSHQQTLLIKLRQQILQEAIEGKLTADWRAENPDLEPASKLLKRIAAEKAQLIKEKKIKDQKPLSPISEEEKPFELPEGWVWCRVRDFASHYVDCPHDTPKYQEGGFPCLRAPDVTESGLLINTVRRVSKDEYEKRIRRLRPIKKDLVYIREGGRLGVAGLIDTDEHICLGQRVMMLRFSDESSANYALRFFNAPMTYDGIVGKIIGSASPHVNVRDVISYVIPVPPLSEQKIIVTKVEKLFALCDQLEAQVSQNRTHAEQLMQAVLKEAFSHTANPQEAATTLEAVNA